MSLAPCQQQPWKENTNPKPVWLRDEVALLLPELVSRRLYLSVTLLHFWICFILCTPVLCSSSLSSLHITCQLDWHVPTVASFSNFARLFS